MPFQRLIASINAHSTEIAHGAIDAAGYLLTFLGGGALLKSCIAAIGG